MTMEGRQTTSLFRVHFLDGSNLDIPAASPAAAREKAEPLAKRQETKITKVKLLREKD
jgi:hypothetical protein